MLFTPVNDLPLNPAVRIFFSGSIILQASADAKTCQAFINHKSLDHTLSIEVRRKRAGKPDQIVMRHHGPLDFVGVAGFPDAGFLIRVSGGSARGIRGYNGTNPSAEGKALSQALDMKDIHGGSVGDVDRGGALPNVLIDDAVFYTADTVPVATLTKKNGTSTKQKNDAATIIGANVYLAAGSKLTLNWVQNNKLMKIDLEKSPDFINEIYIDNDPLYEDDSPSAPIKHDEFEEFYKILHVPENDQFKLTFPRPPSRGSTRLPCMPVLLEG